MTSQELTQKQELLHDHWYATVIPDPIELDQFLRTIWDDPLDDDEEKEEEEVKEEIEDEEATEDDFFDPSVWSAWEEK
jgi:hypothetical protein